MKEIFCNKYKLFSFSLILFFATSILINIINGGVAKIILEFLFPLYFFLLTFFSSYKNKISWDVPIILMIIYMIVGYFCLFDYMSGVNIVYSLFSGLVANIILRIFCNGEYKKLNNEKKYNKKDKVVVNDGRYTRFQKILNISMPCVFLIILEVYYKMCTFGTPNLKIEFLAIIMLLIIIYSIYFLILSLFRSTFKANLIFCIIFLVLFIVNQMRIFYTSDTFLLTDLLFLQTTGELANFVDVTLVNAINYILYPTIIVLAIFTWLLVLSYKYDIRLCNLKITIPMFIVSLSFLVFLFMPTKTVDKFILNNVFDYNKGFDYTISVSNTRYYYKYGVISGMYGKLLESRRYEPDNYDEDELLYALNSVKKEEATIGKPNVIVIFSESFWDVSKLKGIKFNKDVIANFHNLSQNGKVVEMISPSYGGVSANVEFEVLTGGSLNYFSKGYIPYMQLYTKKNSVNNPSVIKEFNNNGYITKIINSSSKVMFDCDEVYEIYGVDEKNHLYDEVDLNGDYVSDKYITDQIINYFDNKTKDEKVFLFALTMGGHMPYYEERYDKYDFEIIESIYNEEISGTIKAYAQGIYKADQELGRLYEYIQTLDEETIIVFFGDHLPHLQTISGKDALFEINYLNNNYDIESVYRQFNTNAIILSNYDTKFDETKYLSPDLLLPYIMNKMDITLSPYYIWLNSTIDVLPSSNYVVSSSNDGRLHYTLGLKGKMKDMYELRKNMQYMLFK